MQADGHGADGPDGDDPLAPSGGTAREDARGRTLVEPPTPPSENAGPSETVVEPAGAPPEDAGRSDTVLEPPAPPLEPSDEELLADKEREPGGAREAEPAGRGRTLRFLASVWAELQRVQWPNRQAVTTLTGVVLGFVLLAGGYLGLLDAIFSRLVQAIL